MPYTLWVDPDIGTYRYRVELRAENKTLTGEGHAYPMIDVSGEPVVAKPIRFVLADADKTALQTEIKAKLPIEATNAPFGVELWVKGGLMERDYAAIDPECSYAGDMVLPDRTERMHVPLDPLNIPWDGIETAVISAVNVALV